MQLSIAFAHQLSSQQRYVAIAVQVVSPRVVGAGSEPLRAGLLPVTRTRYYIAI